MSHELHPIMEKALAPFLKKGLADRLVCKWCHDGFVGKRKDDFCSDICKEHYRMVHIASFHKPEGGNPLDPDSNICDTAPYPECNGANGCDTCEHQPEEG